MFLLILFVPFICPDSVIAFGSILSHCGSFVKLRGALPIQVLLVKRCGLLQESVTALLFWWCQLQAACCQFDHDVIDWDRGQPLMVQTAHCDSILPSTNFDKYVLVGGNCQKQSEHWAVFVYLMICYPNFYTRALLENLFLAMSCKLSVSGMGVFE